MAPLRLLPSRVSGKFLFPVTAEGEPAKPTPKQAGPKLLSACAGLRQNVTGAGPDHNGS
jgi:hypothetical protein